MGQRLVAMTFSDFSPDQQGEGHQLYLDGVGVDIDLTDDELSALIEKLSPYFTKGREIEGAKAPKGSPLAARPTNDTDRTEYDRQDRDGIRAYARLQGWKLGRNGRIPGTVIQAWEAAGKPPAKESQEALEKFTGGQGSLYGEPAATEPENEPQSQDGAA